MTGIGIVLLAAALGAIALTMLRTLRQGGPSRRRPRRRGAPSVPRERPLPPTEADRRALALLRSVVNPEEWAMFRDLGFICVAGHRPAGRATGDGPRHRYLIYPHLPVVALQPRSLAPVREYCIQFPEVDDERRRPLPTGDDVLAKWMTLRGDEDRLLAYANVANVGCQVPLGRIERDLGRLERWERARG